MGIFYSLYRLMLRYFFPKEQIKNTTKRKTEDHAYYVSISILYSKTYVNMLLIDRYQKIK